MDHDGPSTIDLTQDAEYGAPCLLVKPAAEPLPIFAKVEDPFASQFGRQERTRRAKMACQKTKPWYGMSNHITGGYQCRRPDDRTRASGSHTIGLAPSVRARAGLGSALSASSWRITSTAA